MLNGKNQPWPFGLGRNSCENILPDLFQLASLAGRDAGFGPDARPGDRSPGVAHRPDGTVAFDVRPFDPSFRGGIPDLVVAAGPGGGPHVKVFDGVTGREVASFYAYDPGFLGGVSIAVQGGRIYVGAGSGGGPHVRIFELVDGEAIESGSFFAYDPSFRGGVNVAVHGGRLYTGAGPGGSPHIVGWVETVDGFVPSVSFFAFDPTFRGGVNLAVGAGEGAGATIAATPGAGGGSVVSLFDHRGQKLREFLAGEEADQSGARVAFVDSEQTGLSTELLVVAANRVSRYTLAGGFIGDFTHPLGTLDAFVG